MNKDMEDRIRKLYVKYDLLSDVLPPICDLVCETHYLLQDVLFLREKENDNE